MMKETATSLYVYVCVSGVEPESRPTMEARATSCATRTDLVANRTVTVTTRIFPSWSSKTKRKRGEEEGEGG